MDADLFTMSGGRDVIIIPASALGLLFGVVASGIALLSFFLIKLFKTVSPGTSRREMKFPPEVKSFPIFGNFRVLESGSQHEVFKNYINDYGPVYLFKAGSLTQVIVNSVSAAKEVLETKSDFMWKKYVPKYISILSGGGYLVAFHDSDQKYLTKRKYLMMRYREEGTEKSKNLLRSTVDSMIGKIISNLRSASAVVSVKDIVTHSLFNLELTQTFGHCPSKIFVDELGILDQGELYNVLVQYVINCGASTDWRDFFPIFNWVPLEVDNYAQHVALKVHLVLRAFLLELQVLAESGVKQECYATTLLEEAMDLIDADIELLLWEPILESLTTSVSVVEMAMKELSENLQIQERVCTEMRTRLGTKPLSEDDLPHLHLLSAVVQETLRMYPPVACLTPRVATKPLQIGGYDILPGWQVIVNAYGVNMDRMTWNNPDLWNPDRFLNKVNFTSFDVLSFGAGKRKCPAAAQQQSMTFMLMTIGTLLQRFQWRPLPEIVENPIDLTAPLDRPDSLRFVATPCRS